MQDILIKTLAFNNMVRIYALSTTNLTNHATKIHSLWPSSAAALGRSMAVGLMMAILKEQQHTIRINGGGPLGDIFVDAKADGSVRGYVSNPHILMQYNNGKINVGKALGTDGFIYITRLVDGAMFNSSSPLISGEIAEDFAYYFTKSEQINTAISLGVLVNDDNHILASGGFMIQILPNCPDEVITLIENKLKQIESISKMLNDKLSLEEIISKITDGNYQKIGEVSLKFFCGCRKEKYSQALKALPLSDIDDLINDQKAEIICHFCNKKYLFSLDELLKIKMNKTKK